MEELNKLNARLEFQKGMVRPVVDLCDFRLYFFVYCKYWSYTIFR